jgi:dihydrofolate reductase
MIGAGIELMAVVAASPDGGIGWQKGLPWHLPGDLARFRRVTTPHPLLMGRRTWESIGRPLPGRPCHVVTGMPGYQAPGATVWPSVPAALEFFAAQQDLERVCVIGGGQLYEALLPHCDVLDLTVVEGRFPVDVWMPALDPGAWSVEHREVLPADDRNAHGRRVLRLRRVRPDDPGAACCPPARWNEDAG